MTIQDNIEKLSPWFHNIHLPSGEQTAKNHFLGDFPSFKWEKIKYHLPKNLEGYKVLDIGCNAGFYSIELAKLGADVLAIDIDDHYLKQAKWIAKQFGLESKIQFKKMQIYDLAHAEEKYDLIWFMGVFYHLRYPLLALDILSRITDKYLVFQTYSLPGKEEMEIPENVEFDKREVLENSNWPKLAFIENNLARDPTNWWIANHQGILSLLKSSGFIVEKKLDEETYLTLRNQEIPSIDKTWNASEYLSAIGKKWKKEIHKKTSTKNY